MADERAARIAEAIKPLRVKPGTRVHLGRDFDPRYKADFVRKKDGAELLQTGVSLLADYQARLAAQDRYGVLVCLQAMDAGGQGRDDQACDERRQPAGRHVAQFKEPSAEELDHDYLWRYPRNSPRAARSGSSTAPTTRRCWWSGCTRSFLARQQLPEGDRDKGSGRGDTARSTTWSATSSATASGS